MHDPIKFNRDTIKIEGGRKLYNYIFEVEGAAGEEDGDKAPQEPIGNLEPKPEDTE